MEFVGTVAVQSLFAKVVELRDSGQKEAFGMEGEVASAGGAGAADHVAQSLV